MTVVVPVFQMFPDSGQIRLAHQAGTDLISFHVDPTVSPWFLHVVAVGPHCRPLRGRAPDLEIQAGEGLITAVPQEPDAVVIPDRYGRSVATASWTRDATDVFTVQLEIPDPGVFTGWNIRITNNEPQELGFVGTSAASVKDGRQPRIQMNTDVHVTMDVQGRVSTDPVEVPVANIGPGELTIAGPVGADMGAGFVLHRFPHSLAPNSCGKLLLRVTPRDGFAAQGRSTATYTLDCNNRAEEEKTLQLTRDQEKEKEKESKENTPVEIEQVMHRFVRTRGPIGGASGLGRGHFIPTEQRPTLADNTDATDGPGANPSTG